MKHVRKFFCFSRLELSVLLVLEQFFNHPRLAKFFSRWRRSFERRLLKSFSNRRPGAIRQVDQRVNLTVSDFKRNYFNQSRPVVFSGQAKDWPCSRQWDLNFFAEKFGKEDVLLVEAEGISHAHRQTGFEILELQKLIQNIENGGDKYLRFNPLVKKYPLLLSDIDLPWLESMRNRLPFAIGAHLFIGGPGSRTLLHSDQPCNLFIQIQGQKKWTLFPLADSPLLYPQALKSIYFNSPIDPASPDFEKYPLFRYADRYEVILNPGDILFIPPHMWHYVSNLTTSVALAYRFSSISAAVRSSALFSFLRVCAWNPPQWQSRHFGKIDISLILAHANGIIEQVMLARKRREASRARTNS